MARWVVGCSDMVTSRYLRHSALIFIGSCQCQYQQLTAVGVLEVLGMFCENDVSRILRLVLALRVSELCPLR